MNFKNIFLAVADMERSNFVGRMPSCTLRRRILTDFPLASPVFRTDVPLKFVNACKRRIT